MSLPQACVLRLSFKSELYDEMTDALLGFPHRRLSFWGTGIQMHHEQLQAITEQVSGYQRQSVIEVKTDLQEAEVLYRHLYEAVSGFDTCLIPILQPEWLMQKDLQ
ncbi:MULTISPECIES: DUF3240 family protein [Thiomicrorhabdus]|uniref:DUF3240 family protein n=1 Tax=Thiomicrorhabdus heinhorstiae TaxID=2748010 RepID=A0ABS0BY78_9GAMM|nr:MULTISPECIES: DUF3240 family protein [Thiomicrorhabdus]MBF6058751.1 DUF3240 family protein [Thiomicrorhabdus heinhorstiae]